MELQYLLREVDSALVNAFKDYVFIWIYILVGVEGEMKQEYKLAVEYVSWYSQDSSKTQCLDTGEAFLSIPPFSVHFPSLVNFIKPKDILVWSQIMC